VEVRQTYFPGRAEAARRASAGEIGRAEEGLRPESRPPYSYEENRVPAQNSYPEIHEAYPKLSDRSLERVAATRSGGGPESGYVAVAPVSRRLIDHVHKVAQGNSTVLVRGENGAGKDLIASLVHALVPNHDEPLLRMDCTSVAPELIETELFGQEKVGASGGTQQRRGSLELAGHGTLILDEVAALTMPMQAKLLRVIEQKEFERVGGAGTMMFRGRIIALTNVDLERAVARRSFREDLYYRLSVVQLTVPPLRERREDIQPLAEHFLAQFAQVHRRSKPALSDNTRRALQTFSYPGNVRQLRNIVEHVIVSSTGPEIQEADLPSFIRQGTGRPLMSLEQLERNYIAEVLDATRGKKSKAAEILGISRKTLLEKRKRYGLD
jgi:two-component system response regulator AtoC